MTSLTKLTGLTLAPGAFVGGGSADSDKIVAHAVAGA